MVILSFSEVVGVHLVRSARARGTSLSTVALLQLSSAWSCHPWLRSTTHTLRDLSTMWNAWPHSDGRLSFVVFSENNMIQKVNRDSQLNLLYWTKNGKIWIKELKTKADMAQNKRPGWQSVESVLREEEFSLERICETGYRSYDGSEKMRELWMMRWWINSERWCDRCRRNRETGTGMTSMEWNRELVPEARWSYSKEWSVIRNKGDASGRARVTHR